AHADRAVIRRLIDDLDGLSGELARRGDTVTALSRDAIRLSPALSGRPDKVARLLDESAELAGKVGATLRDHGDDLGQVIDGAGDTAATLASRRGRIPLLLDNLEGFFGLLAQVIRVPGPQGIMLAQVVDTLPLDLCQTFVDLCPTTPTRTAFDQPATTVVRR
ncbi:MAG: virulence factor Mce family protein, partial [Actinomadura rubrobrunea]|nr:virulence factor Mce family protein [Actinomadura rubrobrunea]